MLLLAALVSFTTSILNLGLGIRVYTANRNAGANRLFLMMCVALCFWGIGYTFMITADNAVIANYWYIVSAVGWCFFYSVFLLFAIHFTSSEGWLRNSDIQAILPLPGFIFFIHAATRSTDYMTHTIMGWVALKDVPWEIPFILYYTSYSLVGFWLIYQWGKIATATREKRQAKIMLRTMLGVFIVGAPFDTYLPLLGYPVLPIAIWLSTFFVASIGYTIIRYKLMMLNFETAAGHILQHTMDPVVLVDMNSVVREVNASFLALAGRGQHEWIGENISSFLANYNHDEILRCIGSEGEKCEVWLKSHTESGATACLLSGKLLRDEFGDVLGRILMLHDISIMKNYEELLRQTNDALEGKVADRTLELEQTNYSLQTEIQDRKIAEEQARHIANNDLLTGLPNRRQYYEKAENSIAKAEIFGDALAVIFFDLDNFKTMNDTFGHIHGDLILVEVAMRMKKVLRSGDLLSRIGGDEFLLLVEGVRQQDLQRLLEIQIGKLQRIFAEPILINERESFLSVSMGIAVYPQDGKTADSLMKNADIAMYAAKRDGKNKHQFCSELMKAKVYEQSQIRLHLAHAIERQELELHYQPQVDLKSHRIIGVEALLRWKMNRTTSVPPSEFIPIAEEANLVVPLGKWVMNKAFLQLRQWHEQGFEHLTMSVNLSVRQLREREFDEQTMACITEIGVDPRKIELEITESMAFNKDEHIVSILRRIKNHNIGIAIDDFGTDYSSFMNMKMVSFDRLKIASIFVAGIGKNKKDEAIISSIIQLTHKLDLKVIAEGVETEEQMEYLSREGCDEIQGYYYHRPMESHHIEALLRGEQRQLPKELVVGK